MCKASQTRDQGVRNVHAVRADLRSHRAPARRHEMIEWLRRRADGAERPPRRVVRDAYGAFDTRTDTCEQLALVFDSLLVGWSTG